MNRIATLLAASLITLTTACAADADPDDSNEPKPVDSATSHDAKESASPGSTVVQDGIITPSQRRSKCCQYFPGSDEWICWSSDIGCGFF